MRLGDCVINRKELQSLTFQIIGFDGDKARLKVVGLPLTTFLSLDCLVKISSASVPPPLKVIRGGGAGKRV